MYWSAVVFGLLGSFHCIGMCGPIVLAAPGKTFIAKVFYNLGRTITYMSLGAGIGFIGEGFSLFGWQQTLSISIGILMLFIIVFTKYKRFDLPLNGFLGKMWIYAKGKLAILLKSHSAFAPLAIGIINGILPCGLVYAALFTAASMGGVIESSIYMGLFGLGTAPLLIIVSIFGNIISPSARSKFNKLVPYFLGVVAILLILRGLNLGIPYVSPKMDGSGEMKHMHTMSSSPHRLNLILYKPPKARLTRLWVGVVTK